jgi:RimJ/RimL family protein N-acetyltransferase
MTLELIALSLDDAIAIAEDDNSFYAHAANAEEIAEFLGDAAAAQADLYEQTEAVAPWLGYLAYDPEGSEIVGICSFKDMPEDGMVEIAYFTFPGYEGRGWGGAMAAAIVDIAWQTGAVDTIFAHTEPEENAAVRILKKLGFTLVGPMDYPEGPVWQWELRQKTAPAGSVSGRQL